MSIISIDNFLIKEIPKFHPLSQERVIWWREQKRRCIEGYWVGGRYMPGSVYFYVNFWNIQKDRSKNSKGKVLGKPQLRDIEWEKGYIHWEARGFSGFSKDKEYTCNRLYEPSVRKESEELGLIPVDNYKYISAREYLRTIHKESLGKPIFKNEAKNVIDIEARSSGKSYWAAGGLIAHNFIFDGATDYDEYLEAAKIDKPVSSNTLVGAIDAKYSGDLLNKFEEGYGNLEGGIEYGNKFYPSPFFKEVQGSTNSGRRYIEAVRDVRIAGSWVKRGSRSKIYHRTFKDNPFAGNGIRAGLICSEEVGFWSNLIDSVGAMKDCMMDASAKKFGLNWMFGTGGDMDGGSTLQAKEIFFNPETYDCLSFKDIWEGGKNIGYFLPAPMTLNDFKDEEGVTDIVKAETFLQKTRDKLARDKSKAPLNSELMNRPLKPSEAFLLTKGNLFPIKDLQDRLAYLEGNESITNADYIGRLIIDEESGKIIWQLDPKEKPIYNFPLTKADDPTGAIIIYEQPYTDDIGEVPYGRYLIGVDPYDHDTSTTDSLGATLVYDKLVKRIVAEYSGRPATAKEYYENVRRLAIYYNAKVMYENERKGIFDYFEYMNQTYLLADEPELIKDIVQDSKVNRKKGLHMSVPIKQYGEELIKAWLVDSAEDPNNPEARNLHKIRCIPLLKELIAYNEEGNFDRAISLMMVMYYVAEVRKHTIQEKAAYKTVLDDPFWKKSLFKKGYNNN